MPRKVFVTNWIGKLAASAEDVEKFKKQCPPSDCVKSNVVGDANAEHPVAMGFGGFGTVAFTPSPVPGASNAMYEGKLVWSAVYEDGSTLGQYQDGREHSSEEISRDKLRQFCLLTKKNKRVWFVRELMPGWRFFYRRRTAMEQGGPTQVIHIVGWQIPVADEFLTQAAYIYEEDLSIIISDSSLGKPAPILGKFFCWRYPVEYVVADSAVIT